MKVIKGDGGNKQIDKINMRYSFVYLQKFCTFSLYYRLSIFVVIMVLSILVSCFGFVSSNVSAAAGTLTISVPDQVSLDILPSASGTFASTSSDIAVRTTYGHGYTLGIAAKTANSNALINANDSSKTIPSITSSISESTFSSNASYNNRWGYSPSKYNSAANTNYLVAPTSTTMATLDKTSAANSTNNTYTIKLGARIDATLATGTYENTFVFTVTANPTPYTINYDQNTTDTVTNLPTPNPQTSETFATTVNISNTVPARDGYLFKGWCTAQVSDDAACSGTTYNPDGDGTNLSWTIDQTAATSTLDLYAMWEVDAVDMQTMKDTDCVASAPTKVRDARDGEIYLVQRLADGRCWLLDNLRLDPTATPLATLIGNTNASSQTLTYFKNGGGSSPYPATGVNTTWASSSDNKYDEPKIVTTYKDTTVTSYGAGSGKVGVYYNYCAASAGSYCYAQSAGTGNASEDICPAGWRLPTSATSGDDGEFRALCKAYNGGTDCVSGSGSSSYTSMDAASSSSLQYNLSTPLSGYYTSGSASSQGSVGGFWSSTFGGSSNTMLDLYVFSSQLSPSFSAYKNIGRSLRCVKKLPYLQDMTDEMLDELMPNTGDNTTLYDKRDDQGYKVAKLADGRYWLLDNLKLDPTAIPLTTLQGNTNASDQTLTYLKNGGGSNQYPASGVSDAWTSSSQNSYVLPFINADSKNAAAYASYGNGSGEVGVYYNFCAASAGSYCYAGGAGVGNAIEDICPSGWKIPSSNNYNSLKNRYSSTTATSSSSFQYNLSTPISRYFYSGTVQTTYTLGIFWSSTYYTDDNVRRVSISSSQVNLDFSNHNGRSFGYSVRCVRNGTYDISDFTYMQDLSVLSAAELESVKDSMETGTAYTLKDKRDNEEYKIAKLADNNIWMLDNLRLDPTTVSLSDLQNNTNASRSTLRYLKGDSTGTASDKYAMSGVSSSWSSNSYSVPLVRTTDKDNTIASFGNGSGKIGVYYNYCAASAGSYCYGDGTSTGSPSGNATEDICPIGWHMPSSGGSGDYNDLYAAYNSSAYNTRNAIAATLSGFVSNGSVYNRSSGATSSGYSHSWSNTLYDTSHMYSMYVSHTLNNNVNPSNRDNYRYYGVNVRCILNK